MLRNTILLKMLEKFLDHQETIMSTVDASPPMDSFASENLIGRYIINNNIFYNSLGKS